MLTLAIQNLNKAIMKLNLTVVLALCAATMVAQTTLPQMNEPQNAVIEFNGGKYNGYVMEFNAPPDIVEEEVKTHFKPQKVKPKKVDDYMVYRSVVLPQVDAEKKMDAFIKVEKKSKKEKVSKEIGQRNTPKLL